VLYALGRLRGQLKTMRVLGLNGTGNTMWLACSYHDGLIDVMPFQAKLPRGLESGEALIAARDDIRRVLRGAAVGRVVLLSAGNNGRHKLGYHAAVPRITMETVVAFEVTEEGMDFVRVSRATAKSWLGLPAVGGIEAYVDDVINAPASPALEEEAGSCRDGCGRRCHTGGASRSGEHG
jgi:hypothetical protein